METVKDLSLILEKLVNSNKWTGSWTNADGEWLTYAKFTYIPNNGSKYTSLTIPLVNNEFLPDLSKEWVGNVMTDDYYLVKVLFNPGGKTWKQFTEWLKLMVNNPQILTVL